MSDTAGEGPPPWWPPPPPPIVVYERPVRRLSELAEPQRRVARVELLVVGFASAAPGLVFGLKGLNDPTSVTTDVDGLTLLASLLSAFGPAAVAVYLLWRDGHLRAAGFGRPRFGFLAGYGALGFVCCAGALLAVGIVIQLVLVLSGQDIDTTTAENADAIEFTLRSMSIAVLLSVTAGVTEEVVYRGYAISRMEQAGWPRAALVVPWAVWTAQHLYAGPVAIFVIGAVGLPFVWLFWWKRSVWPLVLAHALYDVAIFTLNAAQ